jgi:hypothetical protein
MVDADARYCKHCAFDLSQLSDSDVTQVTTKPADKKSVVPILLIVGVALIGLLVLGLIGVFAYRAKRTQVNITTATQTPTPSATMGEKALRIEEKILRGETLTDDDTAGLTAYELRVLRNVHFARYGRKYDSPGLGDYFSTRPWYKPSDTYSDKLITANDKANINLILAAEKRAQQSDTAANQPDGVSPQNTPVTSTLDTAPAATPVGSSGGGLTDSNVQRAVRSFMSEFTKGGDINVEGVQELPNQNAATADLRFVNWVCTTVNGGGLSKQKPPPLTHDQFGMPSTAFGPKLVTYNVRGLAILKHYNDGRWVLKEVHMGSGFDTVSISGTAEVR